MDSDDLQQLVLRQYEECDCGSGGDRGKCCYRVSVYRALVDSDDLQQLVLRQYEECDCGSGGDGNIHLFSPQG